MKILIWVLTILISICVNTMIGYAIGIRAGSILLYLVECYIAKKLCDKWDERKKAKGEVKEVGKPESVSIATRNKTISETQITATGSPVSARENEPIQFCHKCGAKLINGAKFCQKCGTEALIVSDLN